MSEHPPSGSSSAVPSASMVGEIIDGRYKITKKLGEGGMGEVFAAEHLHIDKRFAIKLLRPEIVSNPEAVSRFRQEARSASSIGHKNIIGIEDFGQLPDGRIYMCMELLNGAPLNDMIKQPMGVDRLLNILIQTGHGLAAAHSKNITHRDMKPENIYVTFGPNNEDIPKLLDFGIAKVAGNDGQNNLTRTGTIFGTPFYMAPEQALGQQVDARADVYAMGVIMYEVFSGTLPFQGESFMGILTQHITTEPEPVAQRAAAAGRQLPPGLAEVISHCMQKDPNRRYPTMDAMVQGLVDVYRAVAGAGMSSYMEAFVAPRTATHTPQVGSGTGPYPPPPQYPPPPGTGPVPHPGHSTGHPMQHQSGGMAHAGTPGSGLYAAGGSGLVEVTPKKSKAGLIFALIAVLAAAGGIVAFIVLGKKKEDSGTGSNGSNGSAVIGNGTGDGTGNGTSSGNDPGTTPDAAQVATTTVDAAGAGGTAGAPDAAQVATTTVDAAIADNPPKAEPVMVLVDSKNVAKFEVWQGSKKLGSNATVVKVEPGTTVSITLKARGYKDKVVVLDGTKQKVEERLEAKGGSGPGSGAQPIDCRHTLKQPKNPECRKQFCDDADHFSNPACME
jgi:serine/threonine protein kinase